MGGGGGPACLLPEDDNIMRTGDQCRGVVIGRYACFGGWGGVGVG